MGPCDGALNPANEPLHRTLGRDYPRDIGYHVQMRDLHRARGGASGNYYDRGHYNDRGGKFGGDEDRVGRETGTPREIETETGSVTQTTQEIETGIVAAIETESTRKRGGSASHLIMSIARS